MFKDSPYQQVMLGLVKQEPHIIWPHHPTQLISEYLHHFKDAPVCGLYTQKSRKGNLHPDAPGGMEQLMLPAPNNTTQTASTPSHNTNAPRTSRLGRVREQQRSWTNQSMNLVFKGWYFRFSLLFLLGGAPAWLDKKQESFEKQTFQPQVAMRLFVPKKPLKWFFF